MKLNFGENLLRIFLISIIIIVCSIISFAQTVSSDSLAVDSVSHQFLAPIPTIGALDRENLSSNQLIDSVINFSNYRYSVDLLELKVGIFSRDFGSLGPLPGLNIFGVDGKGISFFADGIQLNDPFTGIYNPYLFPTESIERIETITGTRAFLYGLNSTGAAINSITKSKKALKPYSRIRYSESGYGFSIIDGMVSQDVLRGMNITAGAQHTVYGQRYLNENYDNWNARIKVRYNLNENFNLFASEMYNQSLLGIWQGVDIKQTHDSLRYEVLQAVVRNTEAYEKIARHDIQLGIASRLLPDTSAISMLTLYYISNVRQYRDLENRPISNGIFSDQKYVSNWFGAKATQSLTIERHSFDFGAGIQSQQITHSTTDQKRSAVLADLYGKGEIIISEQMRISPYSRLDFANSRTILGFGTDTRFQLTPCLTIFGGYSRSYRLPTFQEKIGIDTIISSDLNNDPERHHLLEAGLSWDPVENMNIEIKSFNRIIWNAININRSPEGLSVPFAYTRSTKNIIRGIAGSTRAQYWLLLFEGTAEYLDINENSTPTSSLPRWSFTGALYYRNKILGDHLDLKCGLRGRYFSNYFAEEYNFEVEEYLLSDYGYQIQQNGVLDLVILAHLGQAYIHLIWDNVLNRKYIMNAFYPMPERQMRFGVSWEFLD
ncbi:MAG: TonB-dependent receptor [Ignavibacteriales bacterium]|nr:TonB-dependent receptor [Ignavibacteriales bacterium]